MTSSTEIQLEKDTISLEDMTKFLEKKKTDVLVESYNEQKKANEFSAVISTRGCDSRDFIFIKADTNESIVVTPDHKIYTDTGWIRADNLTKNSLVLDSTVGLTKITDLHKIHDDLSQRVYTLTIDKTQCYFANGLLVHNGN